MEKIIKKEKLQELLNQADAISIDDSPMLTDWNLSSDEENLIDTRWNEDDLEYECFIDEVEKILFCEDGSFHIYHRKETPVIRVARVKLFKITTIGVE